MMAVYPIHAVSSQGKSEYRCEGSCHQTRKISSKGQPGGEELPTVVGCHCGGKGSYYHYWCTVQQIQIIKKKII
jgi:hypothetical protein